MNDFVDQRTVVKPTVETIAKDLGLKRFLLGIYQKMALGLLVTGAMAWAVAHTPVLIQLLFNERGYTPLGWVFALAPLGLMLASNLFMRNLNVAMLALFYWLFVAVMGVTLSIYFLIYTGPALAMTFFITAGAFGGLSIAGYTTKVNMSGWGSFLTMGVIGLILASVVNIFMHNSMLDMAVSALGVLIFSGLIAYKTQWLKSTYYQLETSQAGLAAMTYYGALSLYISFINLFLSILRLTGGRR